MTPTPKLRFVERQGFTEDAANPRTIRILQQWWEHGIPGWNAPGEWRDVLTEQEA
jgi:hypothetical protein